MECVAKCVPQLGEFLNPSSEFGPNLLAWSPLSLHEIRGRQEANEKTEFYTVGHPSKGKITLRYGWVCQRGLYPSDPDKENQDAYKIVPDFDGEERTIMMGVFDGHGEYGDECSVFVRDNIQRYLSKARADYNKDLEKSFRSAFRRLNADMHHQRVRAAQQLFDRGTCWPGQATCPQSRGPDWPAIRVCAGRSLAAVWGRGALLAPYAHSSLPATTRVAPRWGLWVQV